MEVYLNGQWLPPDRAQVSVLDRGFLFGDGIYEVIPVFGGRPFRLAEHLRRLQYSLDQVRIALPWSEARWQTLLQRLIDSNGGGDQSVYLQITRGAAPLREHRFPLDAEPTVFAMSRPLAVPPSEPPAGISCVALEDIRWQRCDIKTTALLGNVLLTQQALDAGAREAILLREGLVWEGASSNVFLVRGDTVYTAPVGRYILGGITRDLLVELMREHGRDCVEEALPAQALGEATEIWVTSSTREMLPVLELDGKPVGAGEVGPVFRQVWDWYRQFRQSFAEGAGP